MDLTFNLNSDDYADFARYARVRVDKIAGVRTKLAFHAYVFYILLGMTLVALLYFVNENKGKPLEHLYAAGLLLGGWIMCAYWYGRRRYALLIRYFTAPDGFFQQQQHLVAKDNELTLARDNATETYQWSAIKGFGETKRLLLFHIDNAQAICVPRRAFASPLTEKEFLAFVQSHIAEHRR